MGIISFVGFTLLVAIIAYLSTRKTDEKSSDGYFLGGRSLTGPIIAGSLLLTNLSTEQIVGMNGVSFSDGLPIYCIRSSCSYCNGFYSVYFVA